jgi:lysozyme family protein
MMAKVDFFEEAVEVVLAHEGGYRNRPSDPGGETNFGITRRSYPHLDIRKLTRTAAALIYKKDWWEKYGYAQIGNRALRLKVFDHAVNIGPGRAHRFLQEAANELIQKGGGEAGLLLRVDGVLGPRTFEAVNALEDTFLLLRFLSRVHKHYKRCAVKQPDELKGWENRLWGCL